MSRRFILILLVVLPTLAGVAVGQLTANPTAFNFGTVIVGSNSSKSLTLKNEGSVRIKVSRIAVIGTGFKLQGPTMPLVLAAGQSAAFSVVFDPPAGVTINGSLAIISDALDPLLHVALSGMGWVAIQSNISSTYFGLVLHPKVLTSDPWPTISFGSIRLWGTQTQWAILNPSEGTYDWTALDSWLNIAVKNGKTDLLYTFGVVPQWASSKPTDTTCVSAVSSAGSCDAPYDVNPDGSGTDKIWQSFVAALVAHASGRIKYWELWNEPDCPYEWSGTNAQLVRMAKDAYAIIKAADPTAQVATPSPVNAGSGHTISSWLPSYLAAGGGAYADIVAFHGYINPALGQTPEAITSTVDQVTSSLTGTLATKPMWDTEGAWTLNTNLPNAELQAAFLARVYLLQWFKGVSRFYWFQYGNTQTGTLWTVAGGPNKAELAYGELYNWLVGATLSGPCSAIGTVWTCSLTKPSGIQEQAVWDASQTCVNEVCGTSSYMPNSIYSHYTDLTGRVTFFAPGVAIQIGAKPVLLSN